MKDVSGKELAIGDKVALVLPRYRGLVVGEVTKFTPTGLRVSFKRGTYETDTFRTGGYVSLITP